MPVAFVEMQGRQALPHQLLPLQGVGPPPGLGPVEAFGLGLAAFVQLHLTLAPGDREVIARRKAHGRVEGQTVHVLFRRAVRVGGTDERCPGLVDEHAVRLVHDGEAQAAHEQAIGPGILAVEAFELQPHGAGPVPHDDTVLEVVEGRLLVGAVGHVAGVGGPARGMVHTLPDDPHGEPQRRIDGPHFGRVTSGEVVVDRDDVHGDAGQSGGAGRQRGRQGLALARLHLGHHAVHQGQASCELDIEVPHAEPAGRRFAHQGEGQGHGAVPEAFPAQQPARLPARLQQLRVGHARRLSAVPADAPHHRVEPALPRPQPWHGQGGQDRLQPVVPCLALLLALRVQSGRGPCVCRSPRH